MAQYKTMSERTAVEHVLVLEAGESVLEVLRAFARDRGLQGASFIGVGGFSRCTLGFFDVDRKRHLDTPVEEQGEVISLVGDVGRTDDGEWEVHAHVVLGLRDGTTRGGRLRAAVVLPTLEVRVTESARPLRRRLDPGTGLDLLDLGDDRLVVAPDPLRHGLAPATGAE